MNAHDVPLLPEEQSKKVRDLFEVSRVIATYLPITLKQSGFTMNNFSGTCNRCGIVIRSDVIRGDVSLVAPEVYQIRGMAWCEGCNLITRIEYRLRELNGRAVLQGMDPQGRWQFWPLQKQPGLLAGIGKWFRDLFSGLTGNSR